MESNENKSVKLIAWLVDYKREQYPDIKTQEERIASMTFTEGDSDMSKHGWLRLGDVEGCLLFDPMNDDTFVDKALDALRQEEASLRADFQVNLNNLKERRERLLALPIFVKDF